MTIRAVLVLAATLIACSTIKTHRPSRTGKGLLLLEHWSTLEVFPQGDCWHSTVRSATGDKAVFVESGCIHDGGVRWGQHVPAGDYILELRRCAGKSCWSEHDMPQLPLVCRVRVTVSQGLRVKVVDRWDAPDRCSVEVRRQPLE